MGIFGKKKDREASDTSADPDEEAIREIREMLSSLEEKIESVDKKVLALEARRQALLDQAIAANEEQRYLEVQRLCYSISQCDEATKTYVNIELKLTQLKSLCERCLDREEFISNVISSLEFIEKFGTERTEEEKREDQMKAEKMLKLVQDGEACSAEINEIASESADESELEAVLEEIDRELAENVNKETENALPPVPTTVPGGNGKK